MLPWRIPVVGIPVFLYVGLLLRTGMQASTVAIGLWLTAQILFGVQYQKGN